MSQLIYIGKSNKKFTHNREYSFWEGFHLGYISIIDNRNSTHFYKDDKLAYFFKNFKLLDDNEYKIFIRTKKLKKINSESERENT